ncbi:MAG TPA: hypothetical protein DCM51_05690 [Actinobacteria bacterium]|nr:hypothetical protein [Actinomycetota bacterium]
MTTSAAPKSAITVTGPRDALDSIPHSLGFKPRNSLVLALLKGSPRRRQVLVVRLDALGGDLKDPEQLDWAAVRAAVTSAQADAALLALYSDGSDQEQVQQEQHQLLARAQTEVDALGLELLDVLVVAAGRFVSLHCDDTNCCPPEGTAYDTDDPGAVGVALAVHRGSSPLADRQALEGELAADAGRAAEVAREIEFAGEHRFDTWSPQAKAEEFEASCGLPITDSSAAHLLLLLDDVTARDTVLAHAVQADAGQASQMRTLLTDLVRLAPGRRRVVPATMLAILHWVDGDGARANICNDIAHDSDEQYRLGELFRRITAAAVAPEQVRRMITDAGVQLAGPAVEVA